MTRLRPSADNGVCVDCSIAAVVSDGLCVSCGTCVAVCPQGAISMRETPGGLLIAKVAEDSCTECGLCRKVCPGLGIDVSRFLPRGADPFRGPVLESRSAQATDPELLRGAQSGGLVSALLLHLLDSGKIDCALLTRMPADGRLRPEVFLAESPDEVLSARGSKYCPVALNAFLKELKDRRAVAVVGLGCHMHGLHKATDVWPWLRDRVKLTIGLFCDRTLSYRAIEFLAREARIAFDDLQQCYYKSKKPAGWPGEVLLVDRDGRECVMPRSCLGRIWPAFTPFPCMFCFEKLNVLSDIAVGDAWGLSADPAGLSVALIRTERGREALESASAAGVLRTREISPSVIMDRRSLSRRFAEWEGSMRWAHARGKPVPKFGCDDAGLPRAPGNAIRKVARQIRLSKALSHDSSPEASIARVRRHLRLQQMKRVGTFPVRLLLRALRKVARAWISRHSTAKPPVRDKKESVSPLHLDS